MPEPPRDQWRSQCDFLLCLIGYSVGTGNMWRFPYLCYKYGGGTFIIAYVTMLFVLGLPVCTMEIALGQFSRQSPNVLYRQLAPIFSGVGYGILFIAVIICFYYNIVITWVIFFIGASFRGELAWARCDHDFNSPRCFTVAGDRLCRSRSSGTDVFWNNTCQPAYELAEKWNETDQTCIYLSENGSGPQGLENNRSLGSEEYFSNYVLGMQNYSANGFTTIRWEMSLCLLCSWLLVALCIFRGIKAFGRILHFTVLLPYAIMFILLVYNLAAVQGAPEGIMLNLKPDLSKLKDLTIWSSAASQILYSLGCGQCGLITIASFNRINNNCMRDAILVAFIDTLSSIFSALIVFSMLGSLSHTLCQDISHVVSSDLGMAFVAYPEIMLHTPLPPLFSLFFFVMMASLGIDTQFIAVEAVAIAVVDQWPSLRSRKLCVVAVLCSLFFLSNLSMCVDGGVLIFALVDHYAFAFSMFLITLLQAVAVGWVYGAERLLENMRDDMQIPMPSALYRYWQLSWRFGVPAASLLGLAATLYLYQPASYAGRRFPGWADAVGLCVMVAPAVLVAATVLTEIGVTQGRANRWRLLFSPTARWGGGRETRRQPETPQGEATELR